MILNVLNDEPTVDKNLRKLILSLSPLLSVNTNLVDSPSQNTDKVTVRAGWRTVMSIQPENETLSRFKAAKYDPTPILEASRDDIIVLWTDPVVRQKLASRDMLVDGMSGL
jgi:hypothetical protein